MDTKWVLTQEAFDNLLAWLDPDREQAGKKYEEIRRRLIKIFTCRGCHEAEDLADETINRVGKKTPDLAVKYTGDPALYFYGVANKVRLEYLKKRNRRVRLLPAANRSNGIEREYECLEQCIRQLPPGNRELVLQYYREDKQARIDHRRDLARQMGIAPNALRIRAHRIRSALQQCMQKCLDR